MKRILTVATYEPYSRIAICLHWVTAIFIVCAFILGWVMTEMPGFSPAKFKYYSLHKSIGVTVFALTLIRLAWRAKHHAPLLPHIGTWQRLLAILTHFVLYCLMLLLPVSGYLYSSASGYRIVLFGIISLPNIIGPDKALIVPLRLLHVYSSYLLLALVVLHVLAAMKHQFVDKNGLLARMIPLFR